MLNCLSLVLVEFGVFDLLYDLVCDVVYELIVLV